MKFAVISDVHIGRYQTFRFVFRKNTKYSKKLLKKFVRKMNKSYKPDFVVQCGDMVEDINQNHDEKNFRAGLKILSKLKCPVYHVIGNHDQRNLSFNFLERTLKIHRLFYCVDRDEFRLIFLLTNQKFLNKRILSKPYLDSSQLSWLKRMVNTDKKMVIFSHASLIPYDTTGNFWFENEPQAAYIENYENFLKIIKDKNIKLAFNGHLHWNKANKLNDVPYITIQSLVENISGKIQGPPDNAYALVNIHNDKISIEIKGKDGLTYKV